MSEVIEMARKKTKVEGDDSLMSGDEETLRVIKHVAQALGMGIKVEKTYGGTYDFLKIRMEPTAMEVLPLKDPIQQITRCFIDPH